MIATKEERVVRLFLAKIEGHVDALVTSKGGEDAKKVKGESGREENESEENEVLGWTKVNYFLTHADTLIDNLQSLHIPTPKDRIEMYKTKTRFLHSVLASISPSPSVSQATESSYLDIDALGLTSKLIQRKQRPTSQKKSSPSNLLKTLPRTERSTSNSMIAQKLISQHESRLRDELFETESGLNVFETKATTNDMNELLKAHQEAQEHMADEMLSLTRSLKEQSISAGEIVRGDTKKLEKASELAEHNTMRLETETARVQTFNRAKCSSSCFMMVLVLFVIFVFIAMVLVMKIFKKRVYVQ